MVNYEVRMTFSNPLFSTVTKYFFNNLVVNINDAFVKASAMTYQDQLEEALSETTKRQRSVRDYLDDQDMDYINSRLKVPRHIEKRLQNLTDASKEEGFEWKAGPRLNRRRNVQTNTNTFTEDIEQNQATNEKKREERSRKIASELLNEKFLSELDREKVNSKLEDKEFVKDVFLLDQALGGAPDYKKKIAKFIKSKIQ